MNPNDIPDLAGIPAKLQLHILTAMVLFKYLGELYHVIAAGGGIKNILLNFWRGSDTSPKETKP